MAASSEEQLKIIGTGFGRTGTESLQKALIELGYKCYHMHEIHKNPQDNHIWVDQLNKPKDERNWSNNLFKPRGYIATVDWPTTAIYEELLKENPNAKVILSIRDSPEQWYNSVLKSIYPLSQTRNWWQFRLIHLFNPLERKHKQVVDLIWNGEFNGRFKDKQYAINIYNQHIQNVKNKVDEKNLLIFNVKQGWEPLCKFLGKEIPKDMDFPRGNTTKDKSFVLRQKYKRRNKISVYVFVFTVIIAGSMYKYYKYNTKK